MFFKNVDISGIHDDLSNGAATGRVATSVFGTFPNLVHKSYIYEEYSKMFKN